MPLIESNKWTGKGVLVEHVFHRRPKKPAFEVSPGWFVINFKHIHWPEDKEKSKKIRHELHGKWFIIESNHGSVIRAIRFTTSGQLRYESSDKSVVIEDMDCIWMDWQAWIELNGRTGESEKPLRLKIKPASWMRGILAVRTHPDPAIRLGGYLGLLSLLLGALSILIAVPWQEVGAFFLWNRP